MDLSILVYTALIWAIAYLSIRLFRKEAKKHNWNRIEKGVADRPREDWDGLHREGEE